MSAYKYLITGPTGATGSAAVAALLEAKQHVRALAHREDERSSRLAEQGVEVVFGDLSSFDDLVKAMDGIRGAYFCYPLSPGIVEATALFAQSAKESGVAAIVNMSQVIARRDAKSHASFAHWMSERVLDWSGTPVTHLRPTFFAEWLLYLSPMIRQGTIYAPYDKGKVALIAAEDQGRIVSSILQNPESHHGKTYPLYGPVDYTFAEMAALVGKTLGREVRYQQVPFEKMMQAFMANSGKVARNDSFTGYAETNIPDASGMSFQGQHLAAATQDHHNGLFAGTNDLVQKLTGRPPMTIEAFVTKHRAAFV